MPESIIAYYHLPGLFEFYELYKAFLPLFREHRDYFYDWCEIGSIYGSPADCIWGGGRVGFGDGNPKEVLQMMQTYGISARLTFSNSLLKKEHLQDAKCNKLCELFNQSNTVQNGVIIYSDILLDFLQQHYTNLYFVSSTTKVLTGFDELKKELARDDYRFVVPDFRHNKSFAKLSALPQNLKDKTEFLCNECCPITCAERKKCYEAASCANLGIDADEHYCLSAAHGGYSFAKAMSNESFIGTDDITKTYLPMGFSHFKIEGRSLGSALILEFLLYYLTKPQYHIHVREQIYLSNTLDLF